MTVKRGALVAMPAPSSTAAKPVGSPYLEYREAMAYLRLKHQQQLNYLIREHGLPTVRRGARLLFDTRELDAWLRGTTALDLRRSSKGK